MAERKFSTYWADSSNKLAGKLIREGNQEIKMIMEDLLDGKSICVEIDEQIVFNQLNDDESSIWSMFLASGYLKVENYTLDEEWGTERYELSLTNKEVRVMFRNMIKGWFQKSVFAYNAFVKAMLQADVKSMNAYMNKVALDTISYFDTGKKPSEAVEPERLPAGKATTRSLIEPNSSVCFYHGFVLGLVVDLADWYTVTSNRESGFGRYDVMLEPHHEKEDAIIMEFKVHAPEDEDTLADTVKSALAQIEDRQYEALTRKRSTRLKPSSLQMQSHISESVPVKYPRLSEKRCNFFVQSVPALFVPYQTGCLLFWGLRTLNSRIIALSSA